MVCNTAYDNCYTEEITPRPCPPALPDFHPRADEVLPSSRSVLAGLLGALQCFRPQEELSVLLCLRCLLGGYFSCALLAAVARQSAVFVCVPTRAWRW